MNDARSALLRQSFDALGNPVRQEIDPTARGFGLARERGIAIQMLGWVTLRQGELARAGALVLESAGARPAAAPVSGLQVARTSPELLDAALRLLRLLKTPQDAAVLAPLIQREIFYRVLTGELGARLRELSVTDSHAQRIARAIDLLKHRFTESLRVEDVAQAAAMSPSTFHQHFKQLTAMSPLQYQKQLRLHHARQLMLGQGLDAAVAGHRVGYESPSQFSREYRRLFGAPPRAEVRQTQAAVAGGA